MAERTVERRIDSSELRNGNVIRTFYPFTDYNGQEKRLVRDMWIRGRNQERDFIRRELKLEVADAGTFISVPIVDILEGHVGDLHVEGVYTPEELNLIDPRPLKSQLRHWLNARVDKP